MPDAQVNIAYPTCELCNLLAFTADPNEMADHPVQRTIFVPGNG